ncbi:MAG: AtpZ/AtpI family protein [Candidatus Aminicenantes bacterium]|nr:AtpZ/AtpI family protein [Candidatus Aminicenantes bacterium]
MILPSSIAVGLVIGYFLDRWLKTGSWMLLLWLVLGIVSGLLNLFRGIRQYFEKNQRPGPPPGEGG